MTASRMPRGEYFRAVAPGEAVAVTVIVGTDCGQDCYLTLISALNAAAQNRSECYVFYFVVTEVNVMVCVTKSYVRLPKGFQLS